MGVEIERKFLVINDDWRQDAEGSYLCQGYISAEPGRIARIRIEGQSARLTIKGLMTGVSCGEWEYVIPLADAQAMLDQVCQRPFIEKKRYRIARDGVVWEIDEFFGENAGLVVAEVELSAETQAFIKPDWLGEEVSHDRRYANANLLTHPYRNW